MRTLLLDNTFSPVRVISWQKAMILWVAGRAEVVDVYQDIDIRSPKKTFKLPKTLRLFARHYSRKFVKLTRFNLFYRDRFICQYCGKKFNYNDLTFDHIVPKSKGGNTDWKNIVAACTKCNSKKADKLPKEAHMYPLSSPKIPKWTPSICLKLKDDDPEEWFSWFSIPKLQENI